MARKSRGASRGDDSNTNCPNGAQLELVFQEGDHWDYNVTWSPNVTAGTIALQFTLDGIIWTDIEDVGPSGSPAGGTINPEDFQFIGEILYLRVLLGSIDGCPDTTSNTASGVVH